MLATSQGATLAPAFVARLDGLVSAYLRMADDGCLDWVSDPTTATPFGSMREATRHAARLPARLRAFGVPRRD